MDSRYRHIQPSSDDRTATGDPDDSELAADRFNQAAGRLNRKVNRTDKRPAPTDRFDTLRLISTSIIILTIATIVGILVRYRINNAPAARPAAATPRHAIRPPDALPVSRPSHKPPAPDSARSAPSGNQISAPMRTPQKFSNLPGRTETSAQQVAAVRPPTQREKRTIVAPADNRSSPMSIAGDDDGDADQTLAFYEPVNHAAKTGSFDIRSGANYSKTPGRTGIAAAADKPVKRSITRMTASLAINAGGTLDKVLEHNGSYYKIKLTLPARRIEYFQKSLAAQEGVATLSVTAESTSNGTSVIILEMNTR